MANGAPSAMTARPRTSICAEALRTAPNDSIASGVAFYPDHGTNAEELVQRADVAMYRRLVSCPMNETVELVGAMVPAMVVCRAGACAQSRRLGVW